MVVVIVVVVAVVLVLAGAFVAVRVRGRGKRTPPGRGRTRRPRRSRARAPRHAPSPTNVRSRPRASKSSKRCCARPARSPGSAGSARDHDRTGARARAGDRNRRAAAPARSPRPHPQRVLGRVRPDPRAQDRRRDLGRPRRVVACGRRRHARPRPGSSTRCGRAPRRSRPPSPTSSSRCCATRSSTLLVGDGGDGTGDDRSLHMLAGEPNVWMFVGVNGVGKTTTIGKLASQRVGDGHRVVLAAGDTFRAAAADQLQLWAERTGGELVRGQEGADPGSVVFDAMAAASGRGADLVLVDTAGRLHTKRNLMEELKKLRRIVDRTPGALKEVRAGDRRVDRPERPGPGEAVRRRRRRHRHRARPSSTGPPRAASSSRSSRSSASR